MYLSSSFPLGPGNDPENAVHRWEKIAGIIVVGSPPCPHFNVEGHACHVDVRGQTQMRGLTPCNIEMGGNGGHAANSIDLLRALSRYFLPSMDSENHDYIL